jgi:hypothetical protein
LGEEKEFLFFFLFDVQDQVDFCFQERKLPDVERRRVSLSADGSHELAADVH